MSQDARGRGIWPGRRRMSQRTRTRAGTNRGTLAADSLLGGHKHGHLTGARGESDRPSPADEVNAPSYTPSPGQRRVCGLWRLGHAPLSWARSYIGNTGDSTDENCEPIFAKFWTTRWNRTVDKVNQREWLWVKLAVTLNGYQLIVWKLISLKLFISL